MKEMVGKIQWPARWCPGHGPGIGIQEVGFSVDTNKEFLTLGKSLNLAVFCSYFGMENEEVELPNL